MAPIPPVGALEHPTERAHPHLLHHRVCHTTTRKTHSNTETRRHDSSSPLLPSPAAASSLNCVCTRTFADGVALLALVVAYGVVLAAAAAVLALLLLRLAAPRLAIHLGPRLPPLAPPSSATAAWVLRTATPPIAPRYVPLIPLVVPSPPPSAISGPRATSVTTRSKEHLGKVNTSGLDQTHSRGFSRVTEVELIQQDADSNKDPTRPRSELACSHMLIIGPCMSHILAGPEAGPRGLHPKYLLRRLKGMGAAWAA